MARCCAAKLRGGRGAGARQRAAATLQNCGQPWPTERRLSGCPEASAKGPQRLPIRPVTSRRRGGRCAAAAPPAPTHPACRAAHAAGKAGRRLTHMPRLRAQGAHKRCTAAFHRTSPPSATGACCSHAIPAQQAPAMPAQRTHRSSSGRPLSSSVSTSHMPVSSCRCSSPLPGGGGLAPPAAASPLPPLGASPGADPSSRPTACCP